jgi:hypothetical protein
MPEGEPPAASRSNSPLFLIGKNSRGQWVVRDQRGLAAACSSAAPKP